MSLNCSLTVNISAWRQLSGLRSTWPLSLASTSILSAICCRSSVPPQLSVVLQPVSPPQTIIRQALSLVTARNAKWCICFCYFLWKYCWISQLFLIALDKEPRDDRRGHGAVCSALIYGELLSSCQVLLGSKWPQGGTSSQGRGWGKSSEASGHQTVLFVLRSCCLCRRRRERSIAASVKLHLEFT